MPPSTLLYRNVDDPPSPLLLRLGLFLFLFCLVHESRIRLLSLPRVSTRLRILYVYEYTRRGQTEQEEIFFSLLISNRSVSGFVTIRRVGGRVISHHLIFAWLVVADIHRQKTRFHVVRWHACTIRENPFLVFFFFFIQQTINNPFDCFA